MNPTDPTLAADYPTDDDYSPAAWGKRVDAIKYALKKIQTQAGGSDREQLQALKHSMYGEALVMSAFVVGVATNQFGDDTAAIANEIRRLPSLAAASLTVMLMQSLTGEGGGGFKGAA